MDQTITVRVPSQVKDALTQNAGGKNKLSKYIRNLYIQHLVSHPPLFEEGDFPEPMKGKPPSWLEEQENKFRGDFFGRVADSVLSGERPRRPELDHTKDMKF